MQVKISYHTKQKTRILPFETRQKAAKKVKAIIIPPIMPPNATPVIVPDDCDFRPVLEQAQVLSPLSLMNMEIRIRLHS